MTAATTAPVPATAKPAPTAGSFTELSSAIPQFQWIAGGVGKKVVLVEKTTETGWTIDITYTKKILWGWVTLPWMTRTVRIYGQRPRAGGTASYFLHWFARGRDLDTPLKSGVDKLYDVVSTALAVIEVLKDFGYQPTLLKSDVEHVDWVAAAR